MEYQISLSLAAAISIWFVLALLAFILGIGAGMILSLKTFEYILNKTGLAKTFNERLQTYKE